jgi:hypothetical protein
MYTTRDFPDKLTDGEERGVMRYNLGDWACDFGFVICRAEARRSQRGAETQVVVMFSNAKQVS